MAEFTAEDQASLAALQAKQLEAAWELNEAARVKSLAAITPIVTALGSLDAITALLTALRAGRTAVDADTAIRIDRIVQVMSVDAVSILYTAQQLSTPAPKPSSSTDASAPTG